MALTLPVAGAAAAPATTNPAARGPDLTSPEFQALRAEYQAARTQAATLRAEGVRPVLLRFISQAEEMLREKQKVRNVKGIAVATAARELFSAALTNLEARRELELPDRVRRELVPMLEEFQTAVAPFETRYSNTLASLREVHFIRFRELVTKTDASAAAAEAEASLRTRFLEWVEAAPVTEPPGADTNAPPATNAAPSVGTNAPGLATDTNAAPDQAALPPDIMAASGDASNWVTVARWTAEMMGMDVIEINVVCGIGVHTSSKFNILTDEESTLTYEAFVPLPPHDGAIYRLKRLPGREAVTVLEWPSSGNGYRLVVRTSASPQRPCPHGFELQVGLPEAELAALFPGLAIESGVTSGPPVTVTINTEPPGAVVYVDDVLYRDAVGPRRTPCEIKVTPGRHALRVALPGYLDVGVNNHLFETNTLFAWKLRPDPRAVRKTFSVPAAGSGWLSSGVRVAAGDLLALEVDGTWTCGSKKEPCGPEGYPPGGKEFYHYYLSPVSSPRQQPAFNYGALLMRIGEAGTVRAVGRRFRQVVAEEGLLFFDINETPGPRFRRDNTGALSIRLLVVPGKPTGAP